VDQDNECVAYSKLLFGVAPDAPIDTSILGSPSSPLEYVELSKFYIRKGIFDLKIQHYNLIGRSSLPRERRCG